MVVAKGEEREGRFQHGGYFSSSLKRKITNNHALNPKPYRKPNPYSNPNINPKLKQSLTLNLNYPVNYLPLVKPF
jgi:hypothetical protein